MKRLFFCLFNTLIGACRNVPAGKLMGRIKRGNQGNPSSFIICLVSNSLKKRSRISSITTVGFFSLDDLNVPVVLPDVNRPLEMVAEKRCPGAEERIAKGEECILSGLDFPYTPAPYLLATV